MKLEVGHKILETTEFGGSNIFEVVKTGRHIKNGQCLAHYAQLSNGIRLHRNQKDPYNLTTYAWGRKINNVEKTTYEFVG